MHKNNVSFKIVHDLFTLFHSYSMKPIINCKTFSNLSDDDTQIYSRVDIDIILLNAGLFYWQEFYNKLLAGSLNFMNNSCFVSIFVT